MTADYTVDGIVTLCDRQSVLLICLQYAFHAPWTCGNKDEFDADKVILPLTALIIKERVNFSDVFWLKSGLDNQVGDVLKTIEEVGKLDNTLVVFLGEQVHSCREENGLAGTTVKAVHWWLAILQK